MHAAFLCDHTSIGIMALDCTTNQGLRSIIGDGHWLVVGLIGADRAACLYRLADARRLSNGGFHGGEINRGHDGLCNHTIFQPEHNLRHCA